MRYKTPGHDIRSAITRGAHRTWYLQWLSNRDIFLRKIKTDIGQWKDRKDRKEQKIISRLRVGHTRITHSHYISANPKPTCTICSTPLTVEHILVNCPQYEATRVNLNLHTSIRNILQNDPVEEIKLINFLKDSNLYSSI